MSSVLERIRRTLDGLLGGDAGMAGTYYGACNERELDHWNYFVFNRRVTTKRNGSRQDYQTFYEVHIVHEDYIPEGYVEAVVAALEAEDESGTKIRATDDDIRYDYVFKGNTDVVVEMATITVFHPAKRC